MKMGITEWHSQNPKEGKAFFDKSQQFEEPKVQSFTETLQRQIKVAYDNLGILLFTLTR
jgi:hypothetical protein